jgi:hypothetical protein
MDPPPINRGSKPPPGAFNRGAKPQPIYKAPPTTTNNYNPNVSHNNGGQANNRSQSAQQSPKPGMFQTMKQSFHTNTDKDRGEIDRGKGYDMRWREHRKSKMIENEIKQGVVTLEETKRRFTKAYDEQMAWQKKRDNRGAFSSPTTFW